MQFLEKIDVCRRGEKDFTLIISDPGGNSYIYSPADEGFEDEELVVEQYKRSEEEEDDLGLLDMRVEDYDGDAEAKGKKNALAAVEELAEEDERETVGESSVGDGEERDVDAGERAAKFEPSDSFSGTKAGFVFKMGAQGLGYYEDAASRSV